MPNPATPTVLQCDGLCFHYPQRPLFAGLSARLPPGVTLVRGGDGSGKTTLLRLLAGDLSAHAGELQVNGVFLQSQAETYRQQVFWANPQSNALDPITAKDYFKSVQRSYPTFDEALAHNEGLGDHRAQHMSHAKKRERGSCV